MSAPLVQLPYLGGIQLLNDAVYFAYHKFKRESVCDEFVKASTSKVFVERKYSLCSMNMLDYISISSTIDLAPPAGTCSSILVF